MQNLSEFEIKEIIFQYIRNEYFDGSNILLTYDTPLISSGYVDSFSMISLLIFLENRFKIRIPSNKATPEAFDTVNNIVALVQQYL